MKLHPILFAVLLALPAAAQDAAKPKMGSRVFDWSKLEVKDTKTGQRREVANSPTATFANFESHVTTLNPGVLAHAPHRHPDEEVIIVKEGTIEVTINGESRRAGAGSIFFFASNDLHGMRNAGEIPATYFVVRIVASAQPAPQRP